MPTYTEAEIRTELLELVERHSLSWESFVDLGESDQLADIDEDLDFAYRALVPLLRDPTSAA